MADLETITRISKQDMENVRNDLRSIGFVAHFGGEIVGLLYYSVLMGLALPAYSGLRPDFWKYGKGLAMYALAQGVAFTCKGLAMSREENQGLADELKQKAIKSKHGVGALGYRLLSRFHYHFSQHSDQYGKVLEMFGEVRKELALAGRSYVL